MKQTAGLLSALKSYRNCWSLKNQKYKEFNNQMTSIDLNIPGYEMAHYHHHLNKAKMINKQCIISL
jgi:hypothetical protein